MPEPDSDAAENPKAASGDDDPIVDGQDGEPAVEPEVPPTG